MRVPRRKSCEGIVQQRCTWRVFGALNAFAASPTSLLKRLEAPASVAAAVVLWTTAAAILSLITGKGG